MVSTFLLAILGTFITRSGVISSVHSFAQSPVGVWFAGLLMTATAVTIYLVATRLKDLEANAELESMVSREAAFLYNNVLLVGIAFSVLWGTLFPILSEAVRGTKITVGPPFFNAVNVPLGLMLLALTGIGPLVAWRRASIANVRRQFAAPAFGGVAVLSLLFALGLREPHALIAYTLAGFVATTILQEFYKGVGRACGSTARTRWLPSCVSSRAIDGAMAATSSTRASWCCSVRSRVWSSSASSM